MPPVSGRLCARLGSAGAGIVSIGLVLLALVALHGAARAADTSERAAYEAAFEAMERDPGNSDKALAYAEAAIAVRDYEGAIGALERLLIFNPNLPRIRLETGVLYFRLGSYGLARSYLGQLANRTDVPSDIQAKAQEYLAEIERLSQPSRWSGSIASGFRYQSNANAGPNGGIARIFGIDLPLTSSFTKKADANFLTTVGLSHVYDFQTAAEPLALESNLTVYGAKQLRQTQFDLSLVQLDTGPRFGLPNLLAGSSIRPYLVGDYLSLGGTSFLNSYGGGLNGFAPITDRLGIEANFEIQNRQYWMVTSRPRIENRSGDFIAVRLAPRFAIDDDQLVTLLGGLNRALAVQGYERYTEFSLGPAYQIRFESPLPQMGLTRPWLGSVSFNRVWRSYAAPDPIVDPNDTRNDREWNVGLSLEIALAKDLSALLQFQQSWVDSTIPNFAYSDTIGAVALAFKF
jgi:hypothetical protein